jgi:hypothetical protein
VMQGFLFSKALPPDALEQWLQQTVLPRKAPWIVNVDESESAEALRAIAEARSARFNNPPV